MKKFKALLATSALALAIPFGLVQAESDSVEQQGSAQETQVLNQDSQAFSIFTEDVNQKLLDIYSKYDLNQPFSEEDAAYVKSHTIPVNPGEFSTLAVKSSSFYGKGSGVFSSVETSGTVTVDIGVINNQVDVNMVTRDTTSKYHSYIGNNLQFTAIGLIGSDGLGKVADFDLPSSTSNGNYDKLVGTKKFVASVAYYSAVPTGKVSDPGNTQTINVTMN
ncbi:hypothetical protein [Paenibacillus azoreducens]|uniref:Uncharacterized protein n=1 Tax=Paenibacillus azoreducens TaxID=116718 RepID=A0A920CTW1_9BACL|nr:hypothetical protein [Paenibacillus azoreducens]GIO48792.1 hypothetical protein J34TS1_35570 [Paenibacillus azoreducens]